LDERLRHYYLDALGVESYVPRVLLSGAARSAMCELADLYDEEIAESVDTILTTAKPVEAKPETVATKSSPMAASVIAGVLNETPAKKADIHTAKQTGTADRYIVFKYRTCIGLFTNRHCQAHYRALHRQRADIHCCRVPRHGAGVFNRPI